MLAAALEARRQPEKLVLGHAGNCPHCRNRWLALRERPGLVHDQGVDLLGLDHEKLTFRHSGADRRLTDVHGEVIHDVLA